MSAKNLRQATITDWLKKAEKPQPSLPEKVETVLVYTKKREGGPNTETRNCFSSLFSDNRLQITRMEEAQGLLAENIKTEKHILQDPEILKQDVHGWTYTVLPLDRFGSEIKKL